jgi:hypothetical protein
VTITYTKSTMNTVTQHAHDQEAAHPNGAQSSGSTQKKNRKRDTIKTSISTYLRVRTTVRAV